MHETRDPDHQLSPAPLRSGDLVDRAIYGQTITRSETLEFIRRLRNVGVEPDTVRAGARV